MGSVSPERLAALRRAAESAESACYPRYSGFVVLSAIERRDGRVYGGANVEVVNLTLCKHAEEAAVLAAIADGALLLGDRWISVVYTRGALPCGSCRQFLWEWAVPEAACLVDLPTAGGGFEAREFLLTELYPEPFDPGVLPDRRPGG